MKRKKKKRIHRKIMKKALVGMLVIVIILPLFSGLIPKQQTAALDPKLAQALLEAKRQDGQDVAEPEIADRCEVLDVLDDSSFTAVYDGKKEVVKLIGIEGDKQESKGHLQRLLSDNYVELEFDTVQRNADGNLLAYVYLEDGRFVNQELLLNGYAALSEETENIRYEELLFAAQQEAKEQNIGMWEHTETDISQE